MGQLLWTYANGLDFQADRGRLRLVVSRVSTGPGFRYAILGNEGPPLASGSRESLSDAIEAAERAVTDMDTALAPAS